MQQNRIPQGILFLFSRIHLKIQKYLFFLRISAIFFQLLLCLAYARIAQLVEHTTDTGGVPSSNLGTRTKCKLNYDQSLELLKIEFNQCVGILFAKP